MSNVIPLRPGANLPGNPYDVTIAYVLAPDASEHQRASRATALLYLAMDAFEQVRGKDKLAENLEAVVAGLRS